MYEFPSTDDVTEKEFSDPDFEYVVKLKVGHRIAFGSTMPRSTGLIGKGLAPFQRRLAPELFKAGPGYYKTENYTSSMYPITHKVRSKRGVGPLGSRAPRFREKLTVRNPSPGRYDVVPTRKEVKECPVPFGTSGKVGMQIRDGNPGPATYDIRKLAKCRRTRYMSNFGRPTMIEAVETFCIPVPVDECLKCERLCEGDYWHMNHESFLCHVCWDEEKRTAEIFPKAELEQFKKIRNCSFMHDHQGTDAAIRTMPRNKIKKKIQLENYLDLYIHC